MNLEFPKDQMMRRSRRISSLAAAHLLPLYGDFTGTATPAQLYVNRRGEAVTCDLFDSSTTAHTIIAGKSRSGKSFLVNHLIQQVLPLGSSVVILDRWASYDTTCEVFGGEYVDVDLDAPICFNPFAGDLKAGHRTFLLALIDQMASGTSGQDAVGLGQIEKAVCSRALSVFAEWHQKERPGEEPLLRDFHDLLMNPTFDDQGRAGGIALRISQYVGSGEYSGFVDGPNELSMTNPLSIFELAKLEKAVDLQSVLLLTLMYRLMQFITNPEARRQRKYLILDEVWALLKHDSAAAFLEEAARALARFRCCAIFMSQQLSDFHSAASQAIKNNSGNYLFLQQNPEEIGTVRQLFDLTDQDVRLLHLVHKRENWGEGYLWQPEGKGGRDSPGAGPVFALAGEPEPGREGGAGEADRGMRQPGQGGGGAGVEVPGGPAARGDDMKRRKGGKVSFAGYSLVIAAAVLLLQVGTASPGAPDVCEEPCDEESGAAQLPVEAQEVEPGAPEAVDTEVEHTGAAVPAESRLLPVRTRVPAPRGGDSGGAGRIGLPGTAGGQTAGAGPDCRRCLHAGARDVCGPAGRVLGTGGRGRRRGAGNGRRTRRSIGSGQGLLAAAAVQEAGAVRWRFVTIRNNWGRCSCWSS